LDQSKTKQNKKQKGGRGKRENGPKKVTIKAYEACCFEVTKKGKHGFTRGETTKISRKRKGTEPGKGTKVTGTATRGARAPKVAAKRFFKKDFTSQGGERETKKTECKNKGKANRGKEGWNKHKRGRVLALQGKPHKERKRERGRTVLVSLGEG